MAGIKPVQIRGWDDYWVQKGTGLSLLYLTPDPSVCQSDDRAYRLLIGLSGIAEANLGTAGGTGLPSRHRRISSRVWEANIVMAEDAVIGDLIPKTLDACGRGDTALYHLQEVQMWQDASGTLRGAAITAQDLSESAMKVLDYTPFGSGGFQQTATDAAANARQAGNAAVEGAKKVGEATSDVLWKLVLPAAAVLAIVYIATHPTALERLS